MPVGFGILDYLAVTLILLLTLYSLARAPRKLLLLLPTFVTVDFFIPLATQLTPSRFVPLMLGGWLALQGRLSVKRPYGVCFAVVVLAAMLSLTLSLQLGDAGLRPILRVLHYLSLIFLFIFVFRMTRTLKDVNYALWGIVIAGAIHSTYSVYQLIAAAAGLPFRGIVYSESSVGVASFGGALGLRVNGLADEPKRLGYVLFCAALAAAYFAFRKEPRLPGQPRTRRSLGNLVQDRKVMIGLAGLALVISLLTYSGSYYAAVAITLAFLLATFSARTIGLSSLAALGLLMLVAAFPDRAEEYTATLAGLFEERSEELSHGLGADKIYRQEFYADAYIREHPEALVTGVGIGRYNRVLFNEYGFGAGYSGEGNLMPLNSQLYEIGFDLGAIGLLTLYFGGFVLVLRIGRRDMLDYSISTMLLFLLFQSFLIQDLQLLSFVAAVGSAMVAQQQRSRLSLQRPYPLASSPNRRSGRPLPRRQDIPGWLA